MATGAFSDHAFSKNAFSVDAFLFGTPAATARGYDPRRAIIVADDLKVIEAIEDFLRRQPWRK